MFSQMKADYLTTATTLLIGIPMLYHLHETKK